MKFRIREKPHFNIWTGKWETHYALERQFLYLFWINIISTHDLTLAEDLLKNKHFMKSRKVIKEIEV